jgi:hypothetical protein
MPEGAGMTGMAGDVAELVGVGRAVAIGGGTVPGTAGVAFWAQPVKKQSNRRKGRNFISRVASIIVPLISLDNHFSPSIILADQRRPGDKYLCNRPATCQLVQGRRCSGGIRSSLIESGEFALAGVVCSDGYSRP